MTVEELAERLGAALDPSPVANVFGIDVYVSEVLPDHVFLGSSTLGQVLLDTRTGMVIPLPSLDDLLRPRLLELRVEMPPSKGWKT